MANEYDFMNEKKMDDWNHYIELFAEKDPYNHYEAFITVVFGMIIPIPYYPCQHSE